MPNIFIASLIVMTMCISYSGKSEKSSTFTRAGLKTILQQNITSKWCCCCYATPAVNWGRWCVLYTVCRAAVHRYWYSSPSFCRLRRSCRRSRVNYLSILSSSFACLLTEQERPGWPRRKRESSCCLLLLMYDMLCVPRRAALVGIIRHRQNCASVSLSVHCTVSATPTPRCTVVTLRRSAREQIF